MLVESWRTLVRHFFTGLDANVTQTLGMLAAPGAFFVLLFQPLLFQGWDLVGVRYLFISLSMIVVAIMMVAKWNALFPDQTDYLVLTPLPVRLWMIFSAKAAALSILVALFLADVNFFATMLWPGIDGGKGFLHILGSHLTATAAAGLFAALAIIGFQGILFTIFTGKTLRRVSAAAQTLLMAGLVMLLFLSPMVGTSLPGLAKHHSPILQWFPGCWFIGFYEQLRPATGNAALLDAGRMAMRGLAGALALVILTYGVGYRRHARRAMETPEQEPAGALAHGGSAAADRFLLRGGAERAVFHFIGQTIARSTRHRLFLAVYAGFGMAFAVLSFGSDRAGLLRLPLMLSFVLVSGLRAAFNFPCELRANWMFQLSEQGRTRECVAATRKWVVARGIVPLFALFVPMEFLNFRWPEALFHLAFGVTLSVMLTGVMFIGFNKVPFTCSYLAGKVNLVGLSVLYVFGFTAYSSTMARFEMWLAGRPAAALVFFAVAAAGWVAMDRLRAASPTLEFEDLEEPAVLTLEIRA